LAINVDTIFDYTVVKTFPLSRYTESAARGQTVVEEDTNVALQLPVNRLATSA